MVSKYDYGDEDPLAEIQGVKLDVWGEDVLDSGDHEVAEASPKFHLLRNV